MSYNYESILGNEDTTTAATTNSEVRYLMLDCRACRSERAMDYRKIYRFPLILRVIGLLFIIPSIAGLLISIVSLLSSFATSASMASTPSLRGQNPAEFAGLAFLMGAGFSIAIAAWSLIAGTVGWIFWMTRKVWKCTRCGHFIDRD